MIPKNGGPALPPSPICLPRAHQQAADYVILIEAALGRPGWSGSQRRRLRELYRLWVWRAEGRDQHFEKYGSFGRTPGSAPPTSGDAVVAVWRRLVPQDATTRRARRVPHRVNERARERSRYGQ